MATTYTGNKIKERMEELHLSYRDLESKTGYSRATLNRYVTGESGIPISRIPNLAHALGVSIEYLMGINEKMRVHEQEDIVTYDVVASVKCGYGSSVVEEYAGDAVRLLKSELHYPVDECFVMRAFGDSMMPYVCHGDLLVIHRQEECDSGIALVCVDDDCTLKKVNRTADSLELIPFNEDFPSIVYRGRSLAQVKICGKLIKLIRDCL